MLDHPSILTYTTAAAIGFGAMVGLAFLRKKASKAIQNPSGTTSDRRSWSFTSQSLAKGCFPKSTNFGDAIINAVMVFEAGNCPTADEIADKAVKILLQYDRYSSIFDAPSGRAVPCGQDMDPSDLVRVVQFAGSSNDGEQEIMSVVDNYASEPLSEGLRGSLLPWWEFLVLQNSDPNGPSAVVWRVHHALGDGISMVNVVQEMFSNVNGDKLANAIPGGMDKKFQTRRSLLEWVTSMLQATFSVLALPVSRFDDATIFSKKPPVTEMRFPKRHKTFCFHPIPLDFVKELKTAAGSSVTVNDILFTCLSQTIHDYLVDEDDPVLKENGKSLRCRTLLPMALPRPAGNGDVESKASSLRNFWCFVSCDLSVGLSDLMDRLNVIHKTLSDTKKSLAPAVTFALQNYILLHFPLSFNRDQLLQLFARHSLVFSNVPGPPEPCLFAGHEVSTVQMIHPNIIPQIGLLSYRGIVFGNLCVGVDVADDLLIMPNRDTLPMHFSRALVLMASKLNVQAPESLQAHAKQLDSR